MRLEIFHPNGNLTMLSDPLDPNYFIDLGKLQKFYHNDWREYATCLLEWGCNELTVSEPEYTALKEFYESFDGNNWRIPW